jgi:hypothetical protein
MRELGDSIKFSSSVEEEKSQKCAIKEEVA